MWRAITYVTSGLTLVAFIVAVAAVLVKRSFAQKERQIKLAPENQRAELIEQALEFFSVDTSSLNSKQQYSLAVEQIHAKAVRFKTTAVVVTILAVLTAGVTAFAIWQDKKTQPPSEDHKGVPPATDSSQAKPSLPTPTPTPTPTQTPPPTPPRRTVRVINRNSNNNQDLEKRRDEARKALNKNASPSP